MADTQVLFLGLYRFAIFLILFILLQHFPFAEIFCHNFFHSPYIRRPPLKIRCDRKQKDNDIMDDIVVFSLTLLYRRFISCQGTNVFLRFLRNEPRTTISDANVSGISPGWARNGSGPHWKCNRRRYRPGRRYFLSSRCRNILSQPGRR